MSLREFHLTSVYYLDCLGVVFRFTVLFIKLDGYRMACWHQYCDPESRY